MPEVIRLDGVLAKEETTYGVDAAPAVATDAVRISRRVISTLTLDYAWENRREGVASGTIIPVKPALPRGRKARADIFWEAKGAGSDAPPESRALYIGSGLPEVDGVSMFDYGPLTSGVKGSATTWLYGQGKLYKMVGSRGHFVWPLVVGEIAMHQFTMFGLVIADPITQALPGGFGYDTTEPIAGVNTALTIGSWTPDWLSGSLDLSGVDPDMLMSGNALDGIKEFDFANPNPTFQLNARVVPLATYDPYADLKARTSRTLAMTWGSAQFNRVKVVGAPLSILSHGHADSDGFADYNLQYFVESGGIIRFD